MRSSEIARPQIGPKRVSRLVVVAVIATAALVPLAIHAEMLGNIGPVYPVAEQSALDMITQALSSKQKSGELDRLQREAVQRSLRSVRNPVGASDLATVTQRSARLLDPTVSYTQAVTTDEGQIVVPAGSRINPLDLMAFTKTLVFFDGRDAAQVKAVHAMVLRDARVKPILVAGSWLDIGKAWKRQVFFDQRGTLSQRFAIRAVPSVIRQQGRALLLEEIPPRDLR